LQPPGTPGDPSNGPIGGPWRGADPGRFTYKNVQLRIVLVYAYDVKPEQIIGPSWIDSERYDIIAKVPAGTDRHKVQLMLQNLLAERFKLTLHRATKIVPIYQLMVAKNGPKLTVSNANAPPPVSTPPQLPPNTKIGVDKSGFPILPDGVGAMTRVTNGLVRMTARAQPISALTNNFEQRLERPVIDKTGLTRKYDFHLEYALEQRGGGAPVDGQDDPGPSLFSAVRDQLGLRLELKKGPMEVLIVDHVDRVPTEN